MGNNMDLLAAVPLASVLTESSIYHAGTVTVIDSPVHVEAIMMQEECFPPATQVQRRLNGVWKDASVLEVSDAPICTWYKVQYLDGEIEDCIDESELRLMKDKMCEASISVSSRLSSSKDVGVKLTKDDLCLTERVFPCPLKRRRKSFDLNHSSTLHEQFSKSTESELYQIRCERYSRENPYVFAPLGARCANKLCRKFTIYRCRQCNSCYMCSLSCQKMIWASGHQQECTFREFKPLFSPFPAIKAVPVLEQNDWLKEDDPLAIAGSKVAPVVSSMPASKSLNDIEELSRKLDINDIFGCDKKEDSRYAEKLPQSNVTAPSTSCSTSQTDNFNASKNPFDENSSNLKILQYSEVFSRDISDVSRIFRFYKNNEDAALECLLRGETKTEEEVVNEERHDFMSFPRAVAEPAPAPSFEDASQMRGTDEEGTEMKPISAANRSAEDWSHLYRPLKQPSASQERFELPSPKAAGLTESGSSRTRDVASPVGNEWWREIDKAQQTDQAPGDDSSDNDDSFAMRLALKDHYFILKHDSSAVHQEGSSVVIFQGLVNMGSRISGLTASCTLSSQGFTLSIDQVRVEIRPSKSVEAVYCDDAAYSSLHARQEAATMIYNQIEKQVIDVDNPLDGLLLLSPEQSSPSFHCHELEFSLSEAIDLMTLLCQKDFALDGKCPRNTLKIREWLDACFWNVAGGDCSSRNYEFEGNAAMLEPRKLGYLFVESLLLHLHSGLLNPFSAQKNDFLHRAAPSSGVPISPLESFTKAPQDLPLFILLSYQVRFRIPYDGRPRAVQSDKAERVVIQKASEICGNSFNKVEELDSNASLAVNESSVQELVDLLMVDREAATHALMLNNGNVDAAATWLLD